MPGASIMKHRTVIDDFELGIKKIMGSKNNVNPDIQVFGLSEIHSLFKALKEKNR